MHNPVTNWHAFVDSDGDASSFLLANSYFDRLLRQARLMVLIDMAVERIEIDFGCFCISYSMHLRYVQCFLG